MVFDGALCEDANDAMVSVFTDGKVLPGRPVSTVIDDHDAPASAVVVL
jgi:hypothetical protein